MDSQEEENNIHLDYIQSKKNFLNLVELYYSTSTFIPKRESFHLMRHNDKKRHFAINKVGRKYSEYGEYKTKIEDDGDVVILIKENNKTLEILPFDKIYDMLMKLHIDNCHEIIDLHEITKDEYKIPEICFDLLVDTCNVCKGKSLQTSASRIGLVTFIQKIELNSQNPYHNAVLIYADKYTEFIIIRPIKSYDVGDTVTELFKIFMAFGTPKKIHMRPIRMHAMFVDMMNNLCPSCEIVSEFQDKDEKLPVRVLDALGKWMKETDSNSWEIGCTVVQREFNTTVRSVLPKTNILVTSHNLFFRNPSIFNNIPDLEYKWFSKPTPTLDSLNIVETLTVTLDETLNETAHDISVVEDDDPLATDVSNLNIEDKPEKNRIWTNQHKNTKVRQVKRRKPKLGRKKTTTKKLTISLSDSEDEPSIHIKIKETKQTKIANAEFSLHAKEKIKDGDSNVEINNIDFKDKHSNPNTTTSITVEESDEEKLLDDDTIMVDFGAEEGQTEEIEEARIINRKASASSTAIESDKEELLYADNTVDFDAEGQVTNSEVAEIVETEVITAVEERQQSPDNDNIIIDFGAKF